MPNRKIRGHGRNESMMSGNPYYGDYGIEQENCCFCRNEDGTSSSTCLPVCCTHISFRGKLIPAPEMVNGKSYGDDSLMRKRRHRRRRRIKYEETDW